MSDRIALENALLRIEDEARATVDAAHDDDEPVSVPLLAALHRLHMAVTALDVLRAEVRERIAS